MYVQCTFARSDLQNKQNEVIILPNTQAAKAYLRQYRGLVARCKALTRAIEKAQEEATDVSVHLKPVSVQTSSSGDAMLNSVIRMVEATEQLQREKARCDAALADVLTAINAVQDETQKAVLTMRYVEGLAWTRIAENINYEERQTFVIHGRGLAAVAEWLDSAQLRSTMQF